MVEIRNVRPDEYDSWLRLRELLWPDHAQEELKREQHELVGNPDRYSIFVAAMPNEGLIGFVEVSLRDWAEGCTTQPVGYMEGWFVASHHRRSNIGRQLIEAAERWAISQGSSEMGSDTEFWNEVGQAAHRALGYSEATRLVCFSKKLRSTDA